MALKILLADDSMTAQNMGKKILMEAGYEVIAVSNGAAAVKKIAEQKPDVVVLDVYMPGYTGLEVCERVKSAIETTKTPVLLTVGKMEPFKPEEGARVKADGVIVKPFEASDLLAAVQKLEQRLGSKNSSQARVMATPAQHSADETPEYERTLKIKTPIFDEGDASYQSWKTATAEHAQPENLQQAPAPQKAQGPQLVTPTPTEPIQTVGAYVESVHAEPNYPPAVRTEKIEVPPVSEEELAAASPESQALHVPTDLQASPALGMEHLDELPNAAEHSTVEFEHTTEVIERSTNEINPYKIVEEASEDTPKSSVGRFFSKAKSLFGGAAIEDDVIGAPKPAEHQFDYESETLPAVSAQPETAPIPPAESPTAPPSHETFVLGSTGPAAVHVEPHAGPSELGMAKAAASGEVSDLHLSSVESWESIVPAPPRLSSTRASSSTVEPELEVGAAPASEEPINSGTAPGLEVTSQPSGGDVPAGASRDAMLVTDVSEMSKEFPTRFGVKDADPVPVGNAAEYPGLYGAGSGAETTPGTVEEAASIEDTQEIDTPEDLKEEAAPAGHSRDLEAQVAAAMGSSWSQPAEAHGHEAQEPSSPGSGWSAEETHLEEHEMGVSLHQEMQQQFARGSAAAEEGLATASAAPNAPAGTASEADAQLAAAMAAAMGTEVTPAITEAVHQAFTGDSTIALDKNTAVIAEIVHRVTERMKPELVAEIARELALEIKKEKK